MDLLSISNLKSVIVFVHLSGLAFGVGGAWMLDLYILRKMYKSPVTQENIQIVMFVSKIVTIGLLLLWCSGLLFIAFYLFTKPELLYNHKIWAKLFIVIVLTINGYCLHQYVLPIISNSRNKVLVETISLKQMNLLTLVGSVSFVTWPLVMFLGTFDSINFTFSFIEIVATYLLILIISLAIAFTLKNLIVEREMTRKIERMNASLSGLNKQLRQKQRDIEVLTKVLK